MVSRIYEAIKHIQDNKEDTTQLLFERLIDTLFPIQIINTMKGENDYYSVSYYEHYNNGRTDEKFADIISRFNKNRYRM